MKRPGIESPCPTCARPLAEHLVSEWVACAGTPWEDLAYEDVPGEMTFSLAGRNVQVADSLTVRAMVTNPMPGVYCPLILLTFGIGTPGQPPVEVAEIGLLAADAPMARKFGKLLRDGAFGAANAVEGLR